MFAFLFRWLLLAFSRKFFFQDAFKL